MSSIQAHTRRNSSASPYSIATKHNHHRIHNQRLFNEELHKDIPLHHVHQQFSRRKSMSGPTLSRDNIVRRISEGESVRAGDSFTCEACGKEYKHVSSLAKHLWEHTPQWDMTKKLLMTKHQQVQMLEAASILYGMNEAEESHVTSVKRSNRLPTSPRRRREATDDTGEMKMRSISFLGHPPSAVEISRLFPGHVGGYIDVPSRSSCVVEEDELEEEEEPIT